MDQRSDKTLIALRRILRTTEMNARKLARETGLTTAQLLVLKAIEETGESTPKAVASETGVSQATATALIDKLEKKGFVHRQRSDQDRRQVRVQITQSGRQTLADAPDPLHDRFVKDFESLPDWERSMILAALERVANLLKAEGLDVLPVLDTAAIDAMPPEDEA